MLFYLVSSWMQVAEMVQKMQKKNVMWPTLNKCFHLCGSWCLYGLCAAFVMTPVSNAKKGKKKKMWCTLWLSCSAVLAFLSWQNFLPLFLFSFCVFCVVGRLVCSLLRSGDLSGLPLLPVLLSPCGWHFFCGCLRVGKLSSKMIFLEANLCDL